MQWVNEAKCTKLLEFNFRDACFSTFRFKEPVPGITAVLSSGLLVLTVDSLNHRFNTVSQFGLNLSEIVCATKYCLLIRRLHFIVVTSHSSDSD